LLVAGSDRAKKHADRKMNHVVDGNRDVRPRCAIGKNQRGETVFDTPRGVRDQPERFTGPPAFQSKLLDR
jgi:hypothetical protein